MHRMMGIEMRNFEQFDKLLLEALTEIANTPSMYIKDTRTARTIDNCSQFEDQPKLSSMLILLINEGYELQGDPLGQYHGGRAMIHRHIVKLLAKWPNVCKYALLSVTERFPGMFDEEYIQELFVKITECVDYDVLKKSAKELRSRLESLEDTDQAAITANSNRRGYDKDDAKRTAMMEHILNVGLGRDEVENHLADGWMLPSESQKEENKTRRARNFWIVA